MQRILVIEDNEDNLFLIRFILQKNGFEVLEARNGADGVEMAVKEKPDLILVDIQLPDINGYEVTKRIRASEADGKIPIIAITSYAMVGDKDEALAAGCSGYIEKPIDPRTIITEIKKYL